MKKLLTLLVATVAMVACLLGLSACGGSTSSLEGEWWMENTNVTIVFTDSKIKMVGVEFDYSVSGNTINYSNDNVSGSMTFEFDDTGEVLTITEDQDGTEVSNRYYKISDDTSAEPRSDYVYTYETDPDEAADQGLTEDATTEGTTEEAASNEGTTEEAPVEEGTQE